MTTDHSMKLPQDYPPTRRRWPWVAGIVAALLLGYGVGAAAQDTPAAAESPEPEVVTETVVETETVEVTPQICVVALDYAYDGFGLAAEFADVVSAYPDLMADAVQAALIGSASQLDAVTEQVIVLNDGLSDTAQRMGALAPDWQAAALACELLAEG